MVRAGFFLCVFSKTAHKKLKTGNHFRSKKVGSRPKKWEPWPRNLGSWPQKSGSAFVSHVFHYVFSRLSFLDKMVAPDSGVMAPESGVTLTPKSGVTTGPAKCGSFLCIKMPQKLPENAQKSGVSPPNPPNRTVREGGGPGWDFFSAFFQKPRTKS